MFHSAFKYLDADRHDDEPPTAAPRRPLARLVLLLWTGLAAGVYAPRASADELYVEVPAIAAPADETLAPGAYLWEPARAAAGAVEVIVDLSTQTAEVRRGGVRIGLSTISSGKPSHATPTGSFPILQKNRDHRSNRYNNAPMPYMQRLTWDGVALHAGAIPGYPASHGCIRLPLGFAKALFAVTSLGATVTVTGTPPAPIQLASR